MSKITSWAGYVNDDEARAKDERARERLMAQLEEAERLLFDEKWSTDDPWPGVIYKPGRGETARVDVVVWVMMRALLRGMGEMLSRQDNARRAEK